MEGAVSLNWLDQATGRAIPRRSNKTNMRRTEICPYKFHAYVPIVKIATKAAVQLKSVSGGAAGAVCM